MGYYKFFQIFKFFFYGFTSRRNRRLLKILLVCIAIFIGIFWLSENCAFASTMNDEDVTQSIKYKYDSICVDFLRRYENLSSQYLKDTIKADLMTNNKSYYIYYGSYDTTGMLNGGTYNDIYLNIFFYAPNTSNYSISFSNYSTYMGLTSNHILDVTFTNGARNIYRLTSNTNTITQSTISQAFIPSELLHYNSWIIYDYFYNDVTLEQIEETLEEVKTTQEQILATQEQIQEDITDDTIDTTQSNPIDTTMTSTASQDVDTQDNFLISSVLNRVKNIFNASPGQVYTIEVPIPHSNGQYITLYSNAISKYINSFNAPMIYTMIQTFWYVLFFVYFFRFTRRVLDWVLSGRLLDNGISDFIWYLDTENTIINASMM